ncbi:DUF4440 domain-containing protein [Streptomyces sp. NPDC020875]|uniref:nuclear transport factor 2 family protein n=1 Tax=Streptomyces sp. NPDC020875 TaxID=3154898 RepID=UPI00340A8F93
MNGTTDGTADETTAVAAAIAAELRLMDPLVRSSREEAARLLDPEFTEVGASGRHWTYETMLAGLADHPGSSADGPGYEPSGFAGRLLAPGVVHLTFETRLGDRRARRSSIWREHPATATGPAVWRMYYHQVTPVPPGID